MMLVKSLMAVGLLLLIWLNPSFNITIVPIKLQLISYYECYGDDGRFTRLPV